MSYEDREDPIISMSNVLKNIGWSTKLNELTMDQILGLVFIIQRCKDVTDGRDYTQLEQSYIKWSGGKLPPGTEIPF
tara:strand:+ start:256 stop:486 length:231 start_codon:yes stop_codon:yes gene_type:complete